MELAGEFVDLWMHEETGAGAGDVECPGFTRVAAD